MDKRGLSSEEVLASKEKYGDNSLTEQKRNGFFKTLLGNFKDPMIIILTVALGINVFFAIIGKASWLETIGIAAAVLIATLVSTFSEYRNENAFHKLQEEASRIFCKTYRDGALAEVPINELVVGDCVVLQTGDKIPADGYIVEGNIKVDQSVLNGESLEAAKKAVAEDYVFDADAQIDFLDDHRVYRGAVVTSGNAIMCVGIVGDRSVYGKIASELQEETEQETPLKLKLRKLAKMISIFGYAGGAAIAVAYLFAVVLARQNFDWNVIGQTYFSNGDAWGLFFKEVVEAILLAVTVIVMAVPEGLPLMIAIVSSQNMGKMLKANVLVRKINGIETAGSINILFSDKTGTITRGKLEVVSFLDGKGESYSSYQDIPASLKRLLDLNALKNTAAIVSSEGGVDRFLGGNATDRALLAYVDYKQPIDEKTVDSVPFSSDYKYSAATLSNGQTFVKGAPEILLPKCSFAYDKDGKKVDMTKELLKDLNDKTDALASRAIRVVALFTSDSKAIEGKIDLKDLALIGFVGIRDEVRPDAIVAIAQVHKAGIQVVMITGDRRETAVAIAKESGIIDCEDAVVLTSAELGELSDEEVKEKLPRLRVVARALPSDKSRLVRLAQSLNLVVGMTGDGVNDSPALKAADVGFAMGGGTEVAKEAAEIVILDDNFSSIRNAVHYGRTIFNSIRKFIVFQLTINVSAVLVCFVCPLLGAENPLTIIQILWVNLVIDTLAALAFGGEPAIAKYMEEKPKRRDESIISPLMWSAILLGAVYIFALSMVYLFAPIVKESFILDPAMLTTGYFAFFIFVSVCNAFNARTEELNLFDNIKRNKTFLPILGGIVVIQTLMIYLGRDVFHCYGMDWKAWLVVLVMSVGIIPVDLARKGIALLIVRARKGRE